MQNVLADRQNHRRLERELVMFTRKSIVAAMIAAMAIGATGCMVDADGSTDDAVGAREDAASSPNLVVDAIAILGQLGSASSGLKSALSLAGVLTGKGQYAQLSNDTVQSIAAAVNQQVIQDFIDRDQADAVAVLNLVSQYNRPACGAAPLPACNKPNLNGYKNQANAINNLAETVYQQLIKYGDNRMQVAQHIQTIGAVRVRFTQELAEIDRFLNNSNTTGVSQNSKNVAIELVAQMNSLEQVYDKWLDGQYNAGIGRVFLNNYHVDWRACVTGPNVSSSQNANMNCSTVKNGVSGGIHNQEPCLCGQLVRQFDVNGQPLNGTTAEANLRQDAENLREGLKSSYRPSNSAKVLGAKFDSARNAARVMAGQYQIDRNNIVLKWSAQGKIAGMTCVQVNEVADQYWYDNYLCSSQHLGLSWSSAGPIAGKRCVRFYEAGDTSGTWEDNYLCSDQYFGLRFSMAGLHDGMEGLSCTQITEPGDLDGWNDNYLCH
ncbi:MAG: hypothetical protein ABJE95_02565 [Byssovorax sp.]